MDLHRENVSELAGALERQIEAQGEAAKLAIREYKKAILHETASGRDRQAVTKRDVEHAVHEYMELRRRLDELRAQMNARQLPTRAR